MELKDFVCETLSQIIEGVKNAQSFASENGACINPSNFGMIDPSAIMCKDNSVINAIQRVDFTLSLTETTLGGGKIGIGVFDIANIGMKHSNTASSVNTVCFSVPLALPTDSH